MLGRFAIVAAVLSAVASTLVQQGIAPAVTIPVAAILSALVAQLAHKAPPPAP